MLRMAANPDSFAQSALAVKENKMLKLRSIALLTALFACIFGLQTTVFAQLSDADRRNLVAEINAAAESINGNGRPDVTTSRQQLRSALDDSRLFFSRATSPANFQAWMDYLDVEELEEAIENDDAGIKAQGRLAQSLVYRLIGTAPGLELSRLQRLRLASQNFVAAVKFGDEAAVKKAQVLAKALAKKIEISEGLPATSDIAFINRILDELNQANQASAAVRAVRDRFNHANVRLSVSESMVQQLASRPVSQTTQVRDCILGTRLVGSASLNGFVTADFQPCVNSTKLQINMNGQICSNNTGYNGPISLTTVGSGQVHASRAVYISDKGISRDPVHVWASLNTAITGINHPLRIVRKIASRKAAQQKPQADRIALNKLRERVGTQFAEETNQAANFSIDDLMSRVTPTLRRLNLPSPSQAWSSTDQSMSIALMMRDADQVGAVSSPPSIRKPYGVAIQLHETTIHNVATKILAGRTMTKEKLRELLEVAGREMDSNDGSEPEKNFEVDFEATQPLVFEARNDKLKIGIRGTRFAQEDREVKGSGNKPLTITATYSPSLVDGRWTLKRDEEINVAYAGSDKGGVKKTAERGRIRDSFAKVFPETLLDRPITIPLDAKMEALRGMTFTPTHISAQDGWFTIAIQ